MSTRRLTLLRHAKAQPDEQGDDHARALAPAGREAAAEMGSWLKKNHALPDLVVCSSATRTRETLAALGLLVPTILATDAYLASAGELLSLLQAQDDANAHVLLVGHNPGIHGLAALLAGEYVREADGDRLATGFPTCGLVSLTLPVAHWRDLAPQRGTLDALRFGTLD